MLTLQVVARDEESGEEVSASVDVEVLQRGQSGEDGHGRTSAQREDAIHVCVAPNNTSTEQQRQDESLITDQIIGFLGGKLSPNIQRLNYTARDAFTDPNPCVLVSRGAFKDTTTHASLSRGAFTDKTPSCGSVWCFLRCIQRQRSSFFSALWCF